MKTKMLKMARRLWNSPYVSRELNRRNIRAWVNSIRQLGDRWVYAKHKPRIT